MLMDTEMTIIHTLFLDVIFKQTKYICIPIILGCSIYWNYSVAHLLVLIFVYCLGILSFQIYNYFINQQLSETLLLTVKLNILKYLSLSISVFALVLYSFQKLSVYVVITIFILYFIVILAREIMSSTPRTYLQNTYIDMCESIQINILVLKYTQCIQWNWDECLELYYYYVWFLMVFGFLGTLLSPILFVISRMHPPNSNQRNSIEFISWAFYHGFFKSISFFYLYYNLLMYLKKHGLTPQSVIYDIHSSFIPCLIFTFVGSILNIIYLYRQKDILKKVIASKLAVIQTGKNIKRELVKIPFEMNIMKVGSNYFKKLVSQRKALPDINLNDLDSAFGDNNDECIICCTNKSNVLIRPCNHGGICESCIIQYLKTNTICPNCKIVITKIYVYEFDESNHKFFGQKVLTIVE